MADLISPQHGKNESHAFLDSRPCPPPLVTSSSQALATPQPARYEACLHSLKRIRSLQEEQASRLCSLQQKLSSSFSVIDTEAEEEAVERTSKSRSGKTGIAASHTRRSSSFSSATSVFDQFFSGGDGDDIESKYVNENSSSSGGGAPATVVRDIVRLKVLHVKQRSAFIAAGRSLEELLHQFDVYWQKRDAGTALGTGVQLREKYERVKQHKEQLDAWMGLQEQALHSLGPQVHALYYISDAGAQQQLQMSRVGALHANGKEEREGKAAEAKKREDVERYIKELLDLCDNMRVTVAHTEDALTSLCDPNPYVKARYALHECDINRKSSSQSPIPQRRYSTVNKGSARTSPTPLRDSNCREGEKGDGTVLRKLAAKGVATWMDTEDLSGILSPLTELRVGSKDNDERDAHAHAHRTRAFSSASATYDYHSMARTADCPLSSEPTTAQSSVERALLMDLSDLSPLPQQLQMEPSAQRHTTTSSSSHIPHDDHEVRLLHTAPPINNGSLVRRGLFRESPSPDAQSPHGPMREENENREVGAARHNAATAAGDDGDSRENSPTSASPRLTQSAMKQGSLESPPELPACNWGAEEGKLLALPSYMTRVQHKPTWHGEDDQKEADDEGGEASDHESGVGDTHNDARGTIQPLPSQDAEYIYDENHGDIEEVEMEGEAESGKEVVNASPHYWPIVGRNTDHVVPSTTASARTSSRSSFGSTHSSFPSHGYYRPRRGSRYISRRSGGKHNNSSNSNISSSGNNIIAMHEGAEAYTERCQSNTAAPLLRELHHAVDVKDGIILQLQELLLRQQQFQQQQNLSLASSSAPPPQPQLSPFSFMHDSTASMEENTKKTKHTREDIRESQVKVERPGFVSHALQHEHQGAAEQQQQQQQGHAHDLLLHHSHNDVWIDKAVALEEQCSTLQEHLTETKDRCRRLQQDNIAIKKRLFLLEERHTQQTRKDDTEGSSSVEHEAVQYLSPSSSRSPSPSEYASNAQTHAMPREEERGELWGERRGRSNTQPRQPSSGLMDCTRSEGTSHNALHFLLHGADSSGSRCVGDDGLSPLQHARQALFAKLNRPSVPAVVDHGEDAKLHHEGGVEERYIQQGPSTPKERGTSLVDVTVSPLSEQGQHSPNEKGESDPTRDVVRAEGASPVQKTLRNAKELLRRLESKAGRTEAKEGEEEEETYIEAGGPSAFLKKLAVGKDRADADRKVMWPRNTRDRYAPPQLSRSTSTAMLSASAGPKSPEWTTTTDSPPPPPPLMNLSPCSAVTYSTSKAPRPTAPSFELPSGSQFFPSPIQQQQRSVHHYALRNASAMASAVLNSHPHPYLQQGRVFDLHAFRHPTSLTYATAPNAVVSAGHPQQQQQLQPAMITTTPLPTTVAAAVPSAATTMTKTSVEEATSPIPQRSDAATSPIHLSLKDTQGVTQGGMHDASVHVAAVSQTDTLRDRSEGSVMEPFTTLPAPPPQPRPSARGLLRHKLQAQHQGLLESHRVLEEQERQLTEKRREVTRQLAAVEHTLRATAFRVSKSTSSSTSKKAADGGGRGEPSHASPAVMKKKLTGLLSRFDSAEAKVAGDRRAVMEELQRVEAQVKLIDADIL